MVIGLLGYGTVGKAAYQILSERRDVTVKYVLSRRKRSEVAARMTHSIDEIIADPEVDAVVELIGGLHPAYEFVTAALKAKKHVVTANKLLMSECYADLVELAMANGVCLRYSAAVGGGIPWLISLERAHRLSRIYSLKGILNGTTNFILDAMQEKGASFGEALARAQALGFAEADPTEDVDGHDAARKTALSADVAFGVVVPVGEVSTFGIRSVTEEDVMAARAQGRVCKLMGHAVRCDEESGVAAWVEPCFVPADCPEADVHEGNNLFSFDGRFVGKESFSGPGAGGYPTGYAVAHDCLDILFAHPGVYNWEMREVHLQNGAVSHPYYVRLSRESAWLAARAVEKWNTGVLTRPLSVSEMHAFAASEIAAGAEIFFAAVE